MSSVWSSSTARGRCAQQPAHRGRRAALFVACASLAQRSASATGRGRQRVIVLPTVLITNASGNRAAIW
jgi:hypothetical protein